MGDALRRYGGDAMTAHHETRKSLTVIQGCVGRRPPERVIALHCSGAGAAPWCDLAAALGDDYELIAPEHYGNASARSWNPSEPFALADEAARTLALIDDTDRKVHLVGHSYGGAVALHVARARPERIASLTLYEPGAFHLLRQLDHAKAALAEIRALALAVATGVVAGDLHAAAQDFVDYWAGPGAFATMHPCAQEAMRARMPAGPLELAAALKEPTPAAEYAVLRFPSLIIRGEHAPAPTRLIAEALPLMLGDARLTVVADAGHMGPQTHPGAVNALVAAHLAARRMRVVAAA
jgi:pimeloyl-ACP methyl ester carboxylesterase